MGITSLITRCSILCDRVLATAAGGPPSELMRLGSGAVIDRSLDADDIVPSSINKMPYCVNPAIDFVFPRT